MDKINILGTEYSLEYLSSKEDKKLENLDGYTDYYKKKIVIEKDFENRLFNENKIRSFYYNGELKAKENKATTALSRTDYNNVYVETVYYNYFDVRIYNRVLTPEEIAHNYEIDKERFLI